LSSINGDTEAVAAKDVLPGRAGRQLRERCVWRREARAIVLCGESEPARLGVHHCRVDFEGADRAGAGAAQGSPVSGRGRRIVEHVDATVVGGEQIALRIEHELARIRMRRRVDGGEGDWRIFYVLGGGVVIDADDGCDFVERREAGKGKIEQAAAGDVSDA